MEDGLPLNLICGLEQTQDGLLWVGTLDGLSRFDGHSFTTYTAADTEGLAGNRIFGVHEEAGGLLWVGTSTGVSTYRDGRFRSLAGASGHVEHFAEGPDGTVWMGGHSGLYRSTSSGGISSVPLPETLKKGNVKVAAGRSDSVWVASGQHLRRYHDGQFQRADRLASKIESRVSYLAVSPQGTLWVATYERLFSVKGGTVRTYVHDGGRVEAIRFAPSGTAWLTTDTAGLLRVANGALQPLRTGPLGGTARGLVRDASGQWWVGEENTGLVRLRPRLFSRVPTGLPDAAARGVYADDEGAVWAGIGEEVVRFTDSTRTRWGPAEGLPGGNVRTIGQDELGTVWVGTNRGLARLRDRRFEEVRTRADRSFRRMSALERDATGTLWIAAQKRGLYRHRAGTLDRVLSADSLFSARVLGLLRAQNGSLWIGTQQHGVARLKNETLTWYDGDDGVPYQSVRDIYQTDDGTIWISTSGGGIARFEGDRFTAVTPAQGLPHRSIHLIREGPEGVFWMTSNGGVFRVRRSQAEAVADGRQDRLYAQAFGTEDGMPARECNGPIHPAVATNGPNRLWIPTVGGLVVVDPRSPQLTAPDSMPVRVTALRADGRPRSLDSLQFAPSTYRFAFDFTAISLRHADDLSFRYRLDDGPWTSAHGRRTAEFTNLGAGTHRFEVQATIDGTQWHTMATPLRVTVAPHVYETTWFRLLVVLGFFGLVLGAYRWRTYRLRERQEELETAVANRTQELVEEKEKTKEQAEKLAELDEAKNRFFAHISHEFRTPLSLILSPLEEALQQSENGVSFGRRQARRMADNARRLQRLIEQLLDLATLEAGRMELDRQPGDLAAVVTRSAEAFRSKAEQKEIDLRIERPEARIETRFDPEKVETIISNLVGNAVKFTPEGGTVAVRIEGMSETVPTAENGSITAPGEGESAEGTARIAVEDTGPGIEPAAQAAIFDRFEQADNSTTREHEGTGLGLALTRELVELHGGTIDVDSAPGAGSRFTVRLPLVPVAESGTGVRERGGVGDGEHGSVGEREPGSVGERERGRVGARGHGNGSEREHSTDADGEAATILVVEDNAEMRAYLREELSPRWTVLEAPDGEEGWAIVQDEAPDLVVSDVMMPETDGFELCRRVKADEALRTIPVLLLTARADEEATRKGLSSGADDYVAKPFDAKELRQRIGNHLAARRHLEARYQETVRLASLGTEVEEGQVPFVETVTETIDEHLDNPDFGVGELAEEVALSRRQLQRRLKRAVGESPSDFLRQCRIERAKTLFEQGAETVSEVAYAAGFRSPSHFSQVFQEAVGTTPSAYRAEATA